MSKTAVRFCKGRVGENQGVHPHPTNKEKQGVRVGCKWEGERKLMRMSSLVGRQERGDERVAVGITALGEITGFIFSGPLTFLGLGHITECLFSERKNL